MKVKFKKLKNVLCEKELKKLSGKTKIPFKKILKELGIESAIKALAALDYRDECLFCCC